MDLVHPKTALVMYKAQNNLLPPNMQTLFRDREGGYALGGKPSWKQPSYNTVIQGRREVMECIAR